MRDNPAIGQGTVISAIRDVTVTVIGLTIGDVKITTTDDTGTDMRNVNTGPPEIIMLEEINLVTEVDESCASGNCPWSRSDHGNIRK